MTHHHRQVVLQWSRDLSIAETGLPEDLGHPAQPASMEPRSFDRGNQAGGQVTPETLEQLQWSRDLSIAETG